MAIGPVQMLVLGFEEPHFTGEILAELKRLREADIVRLIDAIAVAKDDDGNVEILHQSDLDQEEAMEFGAVAGALIGLGMDGEEGAEAGALAGAEALEDGHALSDEEVWYVTEVIPNGSAAAIALIEHRWAIPLRNAIAEAGGIALADEWIHAQDLVAAGVAAADDAE
jgi:uncharacterized membrane protein